MLCCGSLLVELTQDKEKEMSKRLFAVVALVLFSVAVAGATEGINLIGVGPVQQGTAGAGVASAKDSSWLILNPAGLTDVGRQVDASFQYFVPKRTIKSSANPAAGTQSDDSGFFIPALSASLGCCNGQNGFLGVGLYGTSGMGVDYAQPRLPYSEGDTRTEVSIAKLTFTYAQAFDNGFSIGAGPLLVLSRIRTDIETSRMPPSAPASDEWDDAYGAGAIVGANQKINDRFSVGASYQSEQFMSEWDDYDNLFLDSFNLPQQLTVGLAYAALERVELVLDYRWVGWNKLDTLGDQFGWEDQHIVKAGATWSVDDNLTLRAGVSHGNSPIDTDVVFANALFPAIMETHATAGLSYRFQNFALHAAYVHAFKQDFTDSNAPAAGGGTQISMYQNSATVGASWYY